MRIALRVTLAVAATGCLIPAAASAAPPENDNYLQSTRVVENGVWPVRDQIANAVNTSEATVQADLFNPSLTGGPGSGGGAEPTTCQTVQGQTVRFGKTVWYDLTANAPGVIALRASGFDSVLAVYEFDPQTGALRDFVGCTNTPGIEEEATPPISKGQFYTVQIGGLDTGAGPASGPLQASFEFFPDRDRDEIPDEVDKCDRQRGVEAAGGCPPTLGATPSFGYDGSGRIVRLSIRKVPRGSRVQARCTGGCSIRQTITAKRSAVSLKRFVGKRLPRGATIEIRVTHARVNDPNSTYRFGAIGNYWRYTIRPGTAPTRIDRCLRPGSNKPRKRCRG